MNKLNGKKKAGSTFAALGNAVKKLDETVASAINHSGEIIQKTENLVGDATITPLKI
jgi:hypothetical protein